MQKQSVVILSLILVGLGSMGSALADSMAMSWTVLGDRGTASAVTTNPPNGTGGLDWPNGFNSYYLLAEGQNQNQMCVGVSEQQNWWWPGVNFFYTWGTLTSDRTPNGDMNYTMFGPSQRVGPALRFQVNSIDSAGNFVGAIFFQYPDHFELAAVTPAKNLGSQYLGASAVAVKSYGCGTSSRNWTSSMGTTAGYQYWAFNSFDECIDGQWLHVGSAVPSPITSGGCGIENTGYFSLETLVNGTFGLVTARHGSYPPN
jgi:hypothetical protein